MIIDANVQRLPMRYAGVMFQHRIFDFGFDDFTQVFGGDAFGMRYISLERGDVASLAIYCHGLNPLRRLHMPTLGGRRQSLFARPFPCAADNHHVAAVPFRPFARFLTRHRTVIGVSASVATIDVKPCVQRVVQRMVHEIAQRLLIVPTPRTNGEMALVNEHDVSSIHALRLATVSETRPVPHGSV